jgi:hypothetical protein
METIAIKHTLKEVFESMFHILEVEKAVGV